MSTKIFEGKRFPKMKLTQFLHTVKAAHYALILEQARHLAANLRPEELKKNTWDLRVQAVTDLFKKIAEESHRSPGRDLECGWKVWLPEHSRWAFTSPWGEHTTRGALVMPDYVEDYGYWDSTDRPDEIDSRSWNRRKCDWKCATEPGGTANCLLMIVFEAKDYLLASLYVDLQRVGMPSVVDRLAKVAPSLR